GISYQSKAAHGSNPITYTIIHKDDLAAFHFLHQQKDRARLREEHPLYGAELRWIRADIHIAEATKMIQAYSAECAAGVHEGPGRSPTFPKWPPVPPMLSVVLGDAVYNLRASLDY